MKPSLGEAATIISRALISVSNRSRPIGIWNPSLEHALHQLGCRDSLTPSLVARVIDPFLLHHHSIALGFFNWASQQPGFSHTSATYRSIFKSLSLSRQFNAVEKLLKQVKSQNLALDSAIYRNVIASQIVGKKMHIAFSIFNEVNELSMDIGPDLCNSLLAAVASSGHLDYGHTMFGEMSRSGVPMSTLGFGVFIWKVSRNAELGNILGLLDDVGKRVSDINRSIIAVLIIHGLCHASRVSDASIALEELTVRGFKPDFLAYRIVAETFRLTGYIHEAEKTLKKKRKLGVAPRTSDYKDFFFALISERLIQEAKELGEAILSGKFPIEDSVLNALIGSVSAIDPDSATLFLEFMSEKGSLPTLLTLSNLSRNLRKHNKTDKLVEVFQLLSSKNYFSDLDSYNLMVSFLCKAGKVREAYVAIHDMKKKGIDPDISSYNSLMEACCRENLLRPAKRLWDEMFANGCNGNLKTFNTLICKLSEIGQVEQAQQLFHQMLEKGVQPDATTYASLLEGLCEELKFGDAFNIFNMSVEQDVKIATTILSTFIFHLCKKGQFLASSKLLSGLRSDIGHLDSHMIFLKCLADAGEVPIAIEHITWVGEISPSMIEAVYTELLTSISATMKAEPLVKLLRAMHEKGLIAEDDALKDLCNR